MVVLYAFGAYSMAWLVGWFANNYESNEFLYYLFIPLSAILVSVILSLFIEKIFLRKVYGRDEIVIVLVTYGLFLIFEDTMKIIFGTSSYLPYQPRIMLGDVTVFGLPYVIYDLLIIILALLVWCLFFSIIKFTKIGKLLIAVIHDSEIASSMGINVSKFFVYTFFYRMFPWMFGRSCFCSYDISSAWSWCRNYSACFCCSCNRRFRKYNWGTYRSTFDWVIQNNSNFLFSTVGAIHSFFVMAIILTIKPEGLFGTKEVRKI